MTDTPVEPTPPSTPTPETTPEKSPPSSQEIELEIAGVKKSFKKEQILNVLKNYEELQTKSQEYQSSYTQMENLLENLRQNPSFLWDLAESLGHDPKELTKSKFKEYLEYEKMTPEQKKIYDLERKLNSYSKKEEEYKKKEEEAQKEQAIQQQFEKIQSEFEQFYGEHPEIKPSKEFALEMVQIQKSFLDQKGYRPSVKKAYEIYEARQAKMKENLIKSLQNADDLPPEILKLAQKKLQQEARKFKSSPSETPSSSKSKTSKRKKQLTIDDFFK